MKKFLTTLEDRCISTGMSDNDEVRASLKLDRFEIRFVDVPSPTPQPPRFQVEIDSGRAFRCDLVNEEAELLCRFIRLQQRGCGYLP